MIAAAHLLKQRSTGHVHLRVERAGIAVMREAGSAKCRMPQGSTEAILINTSGGLAGGDIVDVRAEAGLDASLALTTQAAERVYRTLGPPATVSITLKAAAGSTLLWVPQETILFESSALQRRLEVDLAEDGAFFAVEPMIFGRKEMGERVRQVSVVDRWNVRRMGRLIHSEAFRLGPGWPSSRAMLGENTATASLLFVSPAAEALLESVRALLGREDGASAWNGKLVARLVARDGFLLRKILVEVLSACLGRGRLPKCWTF